MPKDEKSVEKIVMTRLLRVSAAVHGVVTRFIAGLGIFITTNWLVLKGGRVVGPHLVLLSQVFIGYRVTFVGSLIGFGYGFVLGFVVGYAIAWLYNHPSARPQKSLRERPPVTDIGGVLGQLVDTFADS